MGFWHGPSRAVPVVTFGIIHLFCFSQPLEAMAGARTPACPHLAGLPAGRRREMFPLFLRTPSGSPADIQQGRFSVAALLAQRCSRKPGVFWAVCSGAALPAAWPSRPPGLLGRGCGRVLRRSSADEAGSGWGLCWVQLLGGSLAAGVKGRVSVRRLGIVSLYIGRTVVAKRIAAVLRRAPTVCVAAAGGHVVGLCVLTQGVKTLLHRKATLKH